MAAARRIVKRRSQLPLPPSSTTLYNMPQKPCLAADMHTLAALGAHLGRPLLGCVIDQDGVNSAPYVHLFFAHHAHETHAVDQSAAFPSSTQISLLLFP